MRERIPIAARQTCENESNSILVDDFATEII